MKSILTAILSPVAGSYLLWLTYNEWMNSRTVTVFTKGAENMTLEGHAIWVGVMINGGFSLALIIGPVCWAILEHTSNDVGSTPVICIGVAGFLFVTSLLFYLVALVFF